MASSSTRFDLERFDGSGDFSLWREKMMAVLIYQKLDGALEEKIEKSEREQDAVKKSETETIMKQARSAIIMN